MYLILLCASAVSLFDVTFLAVLGARLDAGIAVVAVCTGVLLGTNGAGRSLAIRLSDWAGRVHTLGMVLALLGGGQLCFAGAVTSGSVPLLLLSALAGVLALGSAALCPSLRQPGRFPVLPGSVPRALR